MGQLVAPDLNSFYDELEKIGQMSMPAQAAQGAVQQPSKTRRAITLGLLGAGALGAGYLGVRYAPSLLAGAGEGLATAGRAASQPGGVKQVMRTGWQHMGKPTQTMSQAYRGGGAKGVAEELGARGWTGKGKYTKYLPGGNKALMTGLPAAFIPMEAKKGDPEFTGQGRAERVGRLAGETAGWVAGAPIGAAGGAMAGSRMAKALKWSGKGGPLVAGLGGALALGAIGGGIGRLAGRPIDLMTGERQQAQAKKGLKTYLEHRQKQRLREQRAAAAQGAAY